MSMGEFIVDITQADEGSWKGEWVAAAEWDQHHMTDPLETLREAKENAVSMLTAQYEKSKQRKQEE